MWIVEILHRYVDRWRYGRGAEREVVGKTRDDIAQIATTHAALGAIDRIGGDIEFDRIARIEVALHTFGYLE